MVRVATLRQPFFITASCEYQLRQINAEVHTGQVVGIIGNSHSGKSTLCRVLAGVIPKIVSAEIEGDWHMFGQRVSDNWPVYNAMNGVVLQNPAGQLR